MNQSPRDAVMHEDVKVLKMPAMGRASLALARHARDGGWEYEASVGSKSLGMRN